ncbi:hypothetical protein KSD_71500 [Ktedonobacter sp. SOSP1-85]|nr:hypothetical protein KSD_71500 [Ktedonobacter sp. SOSP1-85]
MWLHRLYGILCVHSLFFVPFFDEAWSRERDEQAENACAHDVKSNASAQDALACQVVSLRL